MFDNIYVKRIRLKKTREELNMSLQRLADITGISYAHLRQIENRQCKATERELLAIAVALHMPARDLEEWTQLTLW